MSTPDSASGRPALEVLVATYEERIVGLAERLPPPEPGVAWLVSHQVPSGRSYDLECLSARNDVRYFRWADHGLSRNRNHALRLAHGEICLICDDDVEFVPGWSEVILTPFRRAPDLVFATFVSLSMDGAPRKTSFPLEARPHTRMTVGDVSEIEIAFRRAAVRELHVEFDERVGLGTRIAMGEGYVFLTRILERGGIGWQLPAPIVRHLSESSTGERGSASLNRDFVVAQGAFAFANSGYRTFLSIPKTAVWFAAQRGEWRRMPEFACNLTVGAILAARLRLSRASGEVSE